MESVTQSGEVNMKKFWLVYAIKNIGVFKHYDTKEEAITQAKRMQAVDSNNQFVVMEAVSITVSPVPAIEIQEL